MSIIGFEYNVKLENNCPLYDVEPFFSNVKNISEIYIDSERFDNYLDAYKEAEKMMNAFALILAEITNEKRIVVVKKNPAISDVEDNEEWLDTTVSRFYIFKEEDILNNDYSNYEIIADVSMCENELEFLYQKSGSTMH